LFTLSPLVILLLLPTAVYDDDEPAAVVSVPGGKVIEEFESIGMAYDAVVPQNVIALFKENPAIEFVESDAQVKIAQDTSAEYSESWGFSTSAPSRCTCQTTPAGGGVKIAVLDTGVDYYQPTRSGAKLQRRPRLYQQW
jgi:hypothetical protein